MSLKEKNYSVLLVSSAPKFSASLIRLLESLRCFSIETAESVSAAKRRLLERDFDIALITAPLPDENGVSFSIDLSSSKSCVAAIFVGNEYYEQIFSHVSRYGVYVMPRPADAQLVGHGLGWLRTAREGLRRMESRSLTLEEKMREIRAVNRAKWLLITERGMTEEQAHSHITHTAMDRCMTKLEIAEELIGILAED